MVLEVICNRCKKPRGVIHTCVSNSTRAATPKLKIEKPRCSRCKKPRGFLHTCTTKTDFKSRKSAWTRRQKAPARKQDPKHEYASCNDNECPRPYCRAYREGWKLGLDDGYKQGYGNGYDQGVAACPRNHSG